MVNLQIPLLLIVGCTGLIGRVLLRNATEYWKCSSILNHCVNKSIFEGVWYIPNQRRLHPRANKRIITFEHYKIGFEMVT